MTREKAIQFLNNIKNIKHEEAGRAIGKYGFYVELMGYHVEALNMAIKALEQEPKTGHWICDRANVRCSHCGRGYKDFYGKASIASYKYCPNCGADMRGAE